jgi:hypothetical protein
MEARILAGQTDREIAAAMNVAPAVVSAYEQNFFSVKDRLNAADFILSTTIGYTPFRGFDEGDWRSLWAYFAYTAGPKMLELVMAVSQSRRLPDRALHDGAGAELEVGIRAMLLACSGAMTHYKLERLRTLRRRRKAASEEKIRPKRATKPRSSRSR